MTDERIEQVHEVLVSLAMGDDWEAAIEDEFPAALAALEREVIAAYRHGDVQWILDHADAAIELVQPPEFPDARTYRGLDGLLEGLLDWLGQWPHYRVTPRRIFAVGDDQIVTVATHSGRSRHVDLDVEAEMVWLIRWHERRMIRWEMFMSLENALEAGHRHEEA